MKKIFLTAFSIFLFGLSTIEAQPTDRPLHNFYVDKETATIFYQQFYNDSNVSAKVIAKSLDWLLLKKPDNISGLSLDSSSNVLRGHVKNVTTDYYGDNKELEGDFNIVVRNGKYRVYIHNLVWSNKSDVETGNTSKLEEMNINSRGTEWETFAYNIFPDLDIALTKVFSLENGNMPVNKPAQKSDTSWEIH